MPTVQVAPPTYASEERLLALFDRPPSDSRRARLVDALRVATDELVGELAGRDYFRHPASPDDDPEVWSPAPVDIDGNVLHCHEGLVSLTTLTVNDVAVTDYTLTGSGPRASVGYNEPAFHVLGKSRFKSRDTIVLTGVRGWPAIPEALVEACAERARQIAYADGSYSGSIAGPDEFALPGPAGPERWPHVLWRFLNREGNRFAACLFPND